MADEVDLLAEISDDPDDGDSDYGRGHRDGRREMARRLARTLDTMRVASERTGLTLAARAYELASQAAQEAADRVDDEEPDRA